MIGKAPKSELGLEASENCSDAKAGCQPAARDVATPIADRQLSATSDQCAVERDQARARAEQRYRAFLEFLPEPVFIGNLDSTVSYLNPAFEKVFGWTLNELKGRRIPFVPDSELHRTRAGVKQLFTEKVLHGYQTRRLTRDGRILDVKVDGAVFFDDGGQPAGQVIILRDITARSRAEQTNQALFRIARALHRFRQLDPMLAYITRQVQKLVKADGATVLLVDESRQEFYIPAASYLDNSTGTRMREIRFPVDKGVAGYVFQTGKPLTVHDTAASPHFYDQVDIHAHFEHKSILDVPLRHQERVIGVLCAVNKQEGMFDEADVDLLSAVANVVALPIENARIHQALQASFENVRRLNRAKEQVINHLSHELKTPLSVLSASLGLMEKRFASGWDKAVDRVMDRMHRNLKRLLDMQYEISDMLREQHYRAHGILSFLLAASRDMLVSLFEEVPDIHHSLDIIQRTIDREFGRADDPCSEVMLNRLVRVHMETLRPSFVHRRIRLETRLQKVAPVWIPLEVIEKIVEALLKNAIENTPDKGRVEVVVRSGENGPLLEVKDTGVGITAEKQQLIFNHYFAPGDTADYASRFPYDFNAGGKGVDLLRITVFAERYRFDTRIRSTRCRHIPTDSDQCPGDIQRCPFCSEPSDCYASGGTTIQVRFRPAGFIEKTADRVPAENQ